MQFQWQGTLIGQYFYPSNTPGIYRVDLNYRPSHEEANATGTNTRCARFYHPDGSTMDQRGPSMQAIHRSIREGAKDGRVNAVVAFAFTEEGEETPTGTGTTRKGPAGKARAKGAGA